MAEASDQHGMLLQNLMDAGCGEETIRKCLAAAGSQDIKELQYLLSAHRRNLLNAVHGKQKEIDCLDYLMFQLSHEGGF